MITYLGTYVVLIRCAPASFSPGLPSTFVHTGQEYDVPRRVVNSVSRNALHQPQLIPAAVPSRGFPRPTIRYAVPVEKAGCVTQSQRRLVYCLRSLLLSPTQ
jgi:hypothetical protein